ncbi:hypothetical protein Trydic_g20244 [Trypoxylus dichotomus]
MYAIRTYASLERIPPVAPPGGRFGDGASVLTLAFETRPSTVRSDEPAYVVNNPTPHPRFTPLRSPAHCRLISPITSSMGVQE